MTGLLVVVGALGASAVLADVWSWCERVTAARTNVGRTTADRTNLRRWS